MNMENAGELTLLMSQLDDEQNINLFMIVRFLKFEILYENALYQDYKEVMKIYGKLVSRLNKRDKYKVDLNLLDFITPSIFNKITSLDKHKKMLDAFFILTPYEQKNVMNIVNFVYSYKKNNLLKKSNPLTNFFLDVYWNYYSKLIKEIQPLLDKL
ncbi:hypothetical protein FJR11_20810 [Anabaena sp. UHCC 0187]|nr:hypothetical protein [Anabaena sp. UHCC 0187]